MPTLRIQHPISDYAIWKVAFDRFAEKRLAAGVRSERIFQPIDDSAFVMIDLDFDTVSAAEAFLAFLRSQVWSSDQAAPALAGDPDTRIIVSPADPQPIPGSG